MNEMYERCIELAKQSPCQKRGFGTVLEPCDPLSPVALVQAYNKPIEPAAHLCDGKCIRLDIPSGYDTLISACGHSEELAIWTAINDGVKVERSILWVAGVDKPSNEPLVKTDPHFYCIRCATLMHYAGVAGVNVWLNDEWHYLRTEEAYKTSLNYALGKIQLGKGQS